MERAGWTASGWGALGVTGNATAPVVQEEGGAGPCARARRQTPF